MYGVLRKRSFQTLNHKHYSLKKREGSKTPKPVKQWQKAMAASNSHEEWIKAKEMSNDNYHIYLYTRGLFPGLKVGGHLINA